MGDFNRGGGNFAPREMHKAVCDKCKKECEVPFKPTPGKKVYCKECYRSMKQ
jgi:CxxC-x17-CxxC domain-containing protein